LEVDLKKDAKVTSKGQITIPLEIRRALGVEAGDRLVFENNAGDIRVRAATKSSQFAEYRGIGNPGLRSGRKAINSWVRRLRNP
jgi:antitoxin PrlF